MPAKKPRANLVFFLDISGSMNQHDKFPFLKKAFRLLMNAFEPDDTVSIVPYAGRVGIVLEPTKIENKQTILAALGRLEPGGGTAGAQGIKQAYTLAEVHFDKKGVNRVFLVTDGDFNAGINDKIDAGEIGSGHIFIPISCADFSLSFP